MSQDPHRPGLSQQTLWSWGPRRVAGTAESPQRWVCAGEAKVTLLGLRGAFMPFLILTRARL